MPKFSKRLGIVGYSARALSAAAVDLGYDVIAVDAFGDQDLLDMASCVTVTNWPHDIAACISQVDCDAWLLAGGMEHHTHLLSQLSQRAPILGPTATQMRQLRSVRYWRELADCDARLGWPATSRSRIQLGDCDVLFKPFRGSGGAFIACLPSIAANAPDDSSPAKRGYWQAFVKGKSLGVTMMLTDTGVSLCGATASLTAADWPAPTPFIYRGSIGPISLTTRQQTAVLNMAARVREQLGYRGWLQADFVEGEDENDDGRLWLLEINPRWTAGMEVLHSCRIADDQSPLAQHLAAVGLATLQNNTLRFESGGSIMAKAVLYAPYDGYQRREINILLEQCRSQLAYTELQFVPSPAVATRRSRGGWWSVADLPRWSPVGNVFRVGEPVLTVLAGWNQTGPEDSPGNSTTRETLLSQLQSLRGPLVKELFALS